LLQKAARILVTFLAAVKHFFEVRFEYFVANFEETFSLHCLAIYVLPCCLSEARIITNTF